MAGKQKQRDDLQHLKKELTIIVSNVPLWIWWIIVLLFGAFIFQEVFTELSTVEYGGLTFTREKIGDLLVYHYSYYIDAQTKYNLYLRGDPSENDVPIAPGSLLFRNKKVYISINNTGLAQCEDAQVAVGQLVSFLAQNRLMVSSATPDPSISLAQNVTLASCDYFQNKTTLVIQQGEKTQITQPIIGCYILSIQECNDFLPVVEKVIVESLREARDRN